MPRVDAQPDGVSGQERPLVNRVQVEQERHGEDAAVAADLAYWEGSLLYKNVNG